MAWLYVFLCLGVSLGQVFVASPAEALSSTKTGIYTMNGVAATLEFGTRSVAIDVPCGSIDGRSQFND